MSPTPWKHPAEREARVAWNIRKYFRAAMTVDINFYITHSFIECFHLL